MKLDKLGVLKKLVKTIPMPEVEEPKLSELKYPESRVLYKLMVSVDYCCQVEDRFARAKAGHVDPEALADYRKIFKNMMKFMIWLAEADSFYRHRISYGLFFAKSDVFREIFYENLVNLGYDKEWKEGDKLLDMKITTGSKTKDAKARSLFQHIPTENKEELKKEKF